MWDLPGPGLEPMSPALAGGFLTTAPPGKPEKRELLYTVGGYVTWCSSYGKHYGNSSEKLKVELPYDPAIPLLGIYLEKNKNTNSKRYMKPNVHSSSIYNSQDMEATTLVSINRQMEKEDIIYIFHFIYMYIIYNEILLSHK